MADVRKAIDLIGASLSSEIERRSGRDRGYAGLAQQTGFRTATSLIQNITGQSAADVRRATAAGDDLAAAAVAVGEAGRADDDPVAAAAPPEAAPWFTPLTDALTARTISREQYDAIRRGLGEPPVERYPDAADDVTRAWREAGIVLIDEAADQSVEDLRGSARLARDTLDPAGAQLRWDERFARRSFTMWVDEDGQHCARIRFDDDAAAWVRTILSAVLRPRRGPRFVDPERPEGDEAEADTRTNDQLQYDTIIAVLKTGSQADPAQAFGDRQPGVRIVSTGTDVGGVTPIAVYEETGQVVPAGVLKTYLCDAGAVGVTVDERGSPLDVGREKRLYTAKQRIAVAARDGGCLGCGAEPSRCEVHHINEWVADHGRTDLADGVLLCRNCHLRVHNLGYRIRRDDTRYWLHPPPGQRARGIEPRLLRPRPDGGVEARSRCEQSPATRIRRAGRSAPGCL